MIKVKSNYKKGNETNLHCRFCKKDKETQEHILQNCPEMAKIVGKCEYENIFRDDVKTLRELADFIIKVEDKQRVLMHRHQGWNVRHGLCHIYMRYLYIYELFIAFVCFVVCSLL